MLTWRGEGPAGEEQPVRINGTSKRVWRLLDGEGSGAGVGGWPSLAAAALRAEATTGGGAAAAPTAEEVADDEAPPS